jgi:phosphoribosylamine--glycine ligase
MLVHQKFGAASTKVVIEEFLDGIELSCFVLTDGKSYKILPTAKITNALAKATLD